MKLNFSKKFKQNQNLRKMNQKKDWKKELARDFLAIGSIIFFILVIARSAIKPYRPFVDQMIIAGLFLILISILFILLKKKSDNYVARGLILVIFTSIFYNDNLFTAFAIMALIGLIITSYIIDKNKLKIIKGISIGAICSLAGYYLAPLTINFF